MQLHTLLLKITLKIDKINSSVLGKLGRGEAGSGAGGGGGGAQKKMHFSSHTTVSSHSNLTTYDIHTYIFPVDLESLGSQLKGNGSFSFLTPPPPSPPPTPDPWAPWGASQAHCWWVHFIISHDTITESEKISLKIAAPW